MNDAFESACRRFLAVCLLIFHSCLAFAQPCECTNCPLPITDNGSFDAFLDVTVNGADDLSLCPLEQVCFTIDHTWIGDLSVSLTSPAGQNYLVMADANNASGGCGTNEDDLDVCIELGTGSPLTGGGEYICNNGGGPCLIGNWTVPCGVTDPFGGADPAPNCDLNDFNNPGDPANGTWTLSINDVCSQDVGQLITWSLVFGCGVIDCILCEADGGSLNQSDVASCQFDPSLNLSISPNYGSSSPPSSAEYGYVYVVTDLNTGLINGFQLTPSFSGLPVGDYVVCGLSYAYVDAAIYPTYINQPYADLEADLSLLDPVFCGNLSSDCFEVEVGQIPTPGMENVDLCIGDCFNYNGVDYCNPGLYPVMLTSYLGCDSLVNLMINPLSDSNVFIEGQVCPGETLEVGGVGYGAGNHYLSDVAVNGCDSTTTIIITEFYVNASTSTPTAITCTNPSVIITSAGSFGDSFTWYNSAGEVISNYPAVEVFEGGCYDLVVSRDSTGISCSDTTNICVQEIIEETEIPVVSGPDEICFGDTLIYNSSIIPDYQDFDWDVPSGVDVLSGGDGYSQIEVVWNNPNPGQICVSAEGVCGFSLPACLDINFEIALAPPIVEGSNQLCFGDTAQYISILDSTEDFAWSLIGDGTILEGHGTDTVSVLWNSPGIGQICASGISDCGSGPLFCLTVNVDGTPYAPVLTGPDSFCDFDTLLFSATSTDPLNTGYVWDIPSCATAVGGNGFDSILVLMNEPCDSLEICVTAEGVCGLGGTDCVSIVQIPDIVSGLITGEVNTCLNSIESYDILLNPDAINYNWSVIGGTINSAQGSNLVDVEWTDPGYGSLCLEMYGSCNVDTSCIQVYVVPEIDSLEVIGADIVCDSSIVNYAVIDPDTLINTFVWTTSCGEIFSGQGTATVDINWTGCPMGGEVCVYGEGSCSNSPIYCFEVTGGTIPGVPSIVGNDNSCVDITDNYCGSSSDASLYNWMVIGGSIVGDHNLSCVDIIWEQSGNGQVCLITENGCGSSTQTCLDVVLGDAPPIPNIEGADFSCINQSQAYTYSINPNNIIGVEWSIPSGCGTILGSTDAATIDVEWSNSGDCEICIRVENSCGFGPWLCEIVQVQQLPEPNAGQDDAICGLSYNLNANSGGGLLNWEGYGPGLVVFDNATSSNTNVSVSEQGFYTFILEEDVLGCLATDTIIIEFNEQPVASSSYNYNCDGAAENYQLSIEMLAGNGPFNVNGVSGTWSGNTFTSDYVSSGSSLVFEVYDSEGCGPVLIEGTYTCPCISDVGQFVDTSYVLCIGETIDFTEPTDFVLDDNDILSYLVSTALPDPSDLTLGLLFQTVDNLISFNPSMLTGETYFITPVVGNELIGLTDLNDPCISIGSSSEFSFVPLPEFSFVASGLDLCYGDPIVTGVNILNATCADVKLDLGNGIEEEYLCLSDGDLINLPIQDAGNYTVTVVGIVNENGCSNLSSSSFEVNIQSYDELELDSIAKVCNSTETGQTTSIDLSDYIIASTTNQLIWKDVSGCSFTGTLPNIDLSGVNPGSYIFSCEVDPLSSSCVAEPQFITLIVEDCDCPELDVLVPSALCNSLATLDLDDMVIDNTVSVEWSISSEPGTSGYDPAVLTGSVLNLTGAAPGSYVLELNYTETAPVGCVLTNSLQVQVNDQLSAGEALGVLEFCFESGELVDLNSLLDGADAGGVWTEQSEIPSTSGGFSPADGTFAVQSQAVGFYAFNYAVNSEEPCVDSESDIYIRVNANPDLDLDQTGPITCSDPTAELSTIYQNDYEYQWLYGGLLISENHSVTIDNAGDYELIVIDQLTLCESKGSIFVESNQETPAISLFSEELICHNDANGVIEVENTSGGEGPYLYSINGAAYTSDTIFDNLIAGDYQVLVEDVNGCIGDASITILNPDPLDIFAELDYSVFSNGFIGVGDSILIDAEVNTSLDNIESVSWTPSYLVDCDTCLTVYAYPEFTTNLVLEISAGGCSTFETFQLLVRKDYDIFVPNAVSANDDGVNDVFFVQGSNKVKEIRDFEIFDRWGELLFRNTGFLPNNESEGWNGQFKDKRVGSGVYVYRFEVEFIDGRIEQHKGSVTLIR